MRIMSRDVVVRLVVGCLILVHAGVGVGCGSGVTRRAIPTGEIDSARPARFEKDVRFWGDEFTPELEESVIESWSQTRADRGLGAGDQLPPANWLALSGGGSDGAFGAGLLYGWTKAGTRPEFDIVTGISTGALIAPFAFLGSEYDEQLKTIYTTVGSRDIAVFQGILSILNADAAYSTAPLQKLTSRYIDTAFVDAVAREHRRGRRLLIGTTHLDAQRPVVWDMGRIADPGSPERVRLFRQVMVASAAIPAVFPPVYIKVETPQGKAFDEMHVDGGVTRELFLRTSELDLLELREKHNAVRKVDVFLVRNSRLGAEYQTVPPRIGSIAKRSMSTLIKVQSYGELILLHNECLRAGMTFHLTAIPDHVPVDSKELFDKVYMTKLFELGESMASKPDTWITNPRVQLARSSRVR